MLTLTFSTGTVPADAGRRLAKTWLDDAGRLCGRAFRDHEHHWIDWEGAGLFRFKPGSMAVAAWPASGVSQAEATAAFERLLQPVVLQALGWQALHASAVGGRSGVLVFCGRKGCGKSTLSRAFRFVGFEQLADDAVVLRIGAPRVEVVPLPFVSRLREPSQRFFADRPEPTFGPPHPLDCRLRAVFVLRQEPRLLQRARLAPLTGARAFEGLLTHAHCFDETDPRQTRRLVEDYLAMADRVAVFSLTYRPRYGDLSKLVDLIGRTARELGAGAQSDVPAVVQ